MNRNTQGSLASLKELIESRNFGQARLRLMALKEAKKISDEVIKRRLIQLGTDNQAFTEFFSNYERVNSQPSVEPSAPPPLPVPLPASPVGPSAPPIQQFRGTLPTPENPNRKKSNKNKKKTPKLPIIRRRSRERSKKRSRTNSENRKRPTKRRRT